jgi:hypothetical protein
MAGKRRFRIREYDEDPQLNKDAPPGTPTYEATVSLQRRSADASTTSVTGSNVQTTYNTPTWKIVRAPRPSMTMALHCIQAPWIVAQELFLPIAYPRSVREGYLAYQVCDSIQGLCSYLRGVLCSAKVLQAAGVGSAEATAWGAALTWALKDGMGMLGGLGFSYCTAHLFDAHVKEFRLFADLINDVALTLDMLAPYCSSLLLVSAASTLCKTLCGMAAAATKASITYHFALEGNMADLNAKEATQETLVSLIGMLLGVGLAQRLRDYEEHHAALGEQIQWVVFLALTLVHVWANWVGVCLLRLRSLNRERTERALPPYYELKRGVRSPEDMNESLVSSVWKIFIPGLHLNGRLTELLAHQPSEAHLDYFIRTHKRYVLTITPRRQVCVCLLQGATNRDELQAFTHALWISQVLRREPSFQTATAREELVQTVGQHLDERFPKLYQGLQEAGWDVDGRLYLGFSRKRTVWEVLGKED